MSNLSEMTSEIRERCQFLGVTPIIDARAEERKEREVDHEVEREINHEIERETQIERPHKAKAAVHQVHEHVKSFIKTGRIPPHSSPFSSVFAPLRDGISELQRFQDCLSSNSRIELLATADFLTTVHMTSYGNGDYIRPVNWLVSGKDGVLVVLSPYEVNQLLPSIRKSKNVHLHVYTPRTTQFMKSIDDLKLYCIPSLPSSWQGPSHTTIDLLNLAAGQLYFPDYEAYLRVSALLGICTPEDQREQNMQVQSDGFIRPENRFGRVKEACLFDESPYRT
ncbi:hypothetical protein MPER_09227 [Moniliophthora perniciosa FA553]|nr:hypothetical protein MPER_09227 [Moniliophthora perniciosa FA553]